MADPDLWDDTVETLLHLFRYIERLHLNYSWIGHLQETVAAARVQDTGRYCELLSRLGQLLRYQDDLPALRQALAIHQEALTLAQKLADPLLLGLAYFQLASDYQRLHRAAEGLPLAEKALHLFQQKGGTPQQLGSACSILGLLTLDSQQLEQAEAYFVQALALREQQPDGLIEQARLFISWGYALTNMSRPDAALEKFRLAEQRLVASGDLYDLFLCHINLASIYYWREEYETALTLFRNIDTEYLRARDHLWLLAMTAHGVGDCTQAVGRPGEGLPYLDEAIRLWRQQENPLRLAYSLATRYGGYRRLNRETDAARDKAETLALIAANPNHIVAKQTAAALQRYT